MNRYLTPAIVSIAVFMLCISILLVEQKNQMDSIILFICLGYALTCLFFLIFQIIAFIKVHTDYDEEIEDIKYQVFKAEGIPYDEVKEELV